MIIITSGKKYLDIDAYASMIAYRELLRALGEEAYAVSSASPNSSVPSMIKNLSYELDNISPTADTEYILVDVSNPDFFDTLVNTDNITEIIDHHDGFLDFWDKKGVKNQIEFIGSVCTMIYEKIAESGQEKILDSNLCKLLAAGILDNTLNLRADITDKRDTEAYGRLKIIGGISDEWSAEYFAACDAEKAKNYEQAILNDLKIEKVNPIFPKVFGQIILGSANKIDYATIERALANYDEWVVNIISLEDGKSYLYFKDGGVGESLEKMFGILRHNERLLVLDKFLLRKQILRIVRQTH